MPERVRSAYLNIKDSNNQKKVDVNNHNGSFKLNSGSYEIVTLKKE